MCLLHTFLLCIMFEMVKLYRDMPPCHCRGTVDAGEVPYGGCHSGRRGRYTAASTK